MLVEQCGCCRRCHTPMCQLTHIAGVKQCVLQAVPYAQDELVLLVPSSHELAQRGSIEKCELYNLDFVSMNQGSSVQAAQEETLLQQGIKWHKLRTHMVGLLAPPHVHQGQ